jgi:SAM-dependent methyltransferase
LCGSESVSIILDKPLLRAMRGDNNIATQPLRKLECTTCGLVRDGNVYTPEFLMGMYAHDYTLDTTAQEYQFLTRDGPIFRSKVLHDWIWQHLDPQRRSHLSRILEIGCGAGYLLRRMQASLPWAQCLGIEFNNSAREIAIRYGCRVITGGIEQISEDSFDLIYMVTVLEHVAQPGKFLTQIRERLSDDGLLVLAQPTQDVPSSDIYFAEHLHHFGTDHLGMYARRTGFTEQVKAVGHPLMPNFSLHVWQKAKSSSEPIRRGRTCCRESVAQHEADFARVNDLVREIELDPGRNLAVFGLNERYSLLAAYSRLGDAKIVCGLSDVESNVSVDFPVVKPEFVTSFPVSDVLLCVNKIHLQFVRERMSGFNLAIHSI